MQQSCGLDPLQEIRERYPPWLAAHRDSLPAEDLARFEAQYAAVQRVVAHYEAGGDFPRLMELIQEVCGWGVARCA